MEDRIKVYVQVANNNIVTEIASSIQDIDFSNWIKIDEGLGDKFSHAQGNYLEKPLADMKGKYNYKLVYGKVVELTEEEKEKLFLDRMPKPTETELLKQQLLETQAILANLQIEILLKQNGGM